MVDVNNIKYSDFENLCESLKKCLDEYNDSKNYYKDTYYTLYLSNGDRINYSIPKSSVAHLLGINTEEIKIWNFYKSKSSYEILDYICDNSYEFHKKMRQSGKLYKSIISPYIDTKIRIFDTHFKSAREKINNIEFICKYNRNYAYISGNDAKDVDYVIASRDGDFMTLLGLIKIESDYIPITSQLIDLKTEEGKKTLNSFIKNQVLTIPETLKSKKGYWEETGYFYDNVLLQKLKNLEEYKKEYGCIVDVSHTLVYSKKKEIDSRIAVTAACESIISGTPIKAVTFNGKVPKYIEDLLLYIDSLVPESREDKIKQLETYKEALLAVEELESKVNNLNDTIEQKNDIINGLRDRVNSLEEENKCLDTSIEQIIAIASGVTKTKKK